MSKSIAIIQSNYIPWKGYFDFIRIVDEIILFDDVQYTRRDWRNRNKIKTSQGLQWLTIPVEVKGKFFQKIRDTKIEDPNWNMKHWCTIRQNYAQARYYHDYRDFIEELYRTATQSYLSEVNFHFLAAFCQLLGIQTRITWSMDYGVIEGKTERLVDLCKKAGATAYLSGPSAKNYIDESLFDDAGITLSYMDYSDYQEYEQLFPPFDHAVSIIDLLFNTGPDAPKYLKGFQ
ncbi:MAG: WbqC family protein [Chloroflexi bacterium]|nr:WbqC family protein [Chloroflexota bacterium]